MKNQFDGIVKVKKQLLDIAQMDLLKMRQKAQEITMQIAQISSDIASLEIPKSGGFSLIGQMREKMRLLLLHKDSLKLELDRVKFFVSELEERYKRADKELEKMKYLQQQEVAKHLKKLKKHEQVMLDEISVQLFARNRQQES